MKGRTNKNNGKTMKLIQLNWMSSTTHLTELPARSWTICSHLIPANDQFRVKHEESPYVKAIVYWRSSELSMYVSPKIGY